MAEAAEMVRWGIVAVLFAAMAFTGEIVPPAVLLAVIAVIGRLLTRRPGRTWPIVLAIVIGRGIANHGIFGTKWTK